VQDHIETIEAGYEYLLAYAAQGKQTDRTSSGKPSEVRTILAGMAESTLGIVDEFENGDSIMGWVIVDDARKAHSAISLVLAQDDIGSELVDNLNASIHLRALLTDLFLISEATAR